jgi:hypothetical protein
MSKNYSKYKERYLLLKNQYGGANKGEHVFSKDGIYLGKITKVGRDTITYISKEKKGELTLHPGDQNLLWNVIKAEIGSDLYDKSNNNYLGRILYQDQTNKKWIIKKENETKFADPIEENEKWYIGAPFNTSTNEPSKNWRTWFLEQSKRAAGAARAVVARAAVAATTAATGAAVAATGAAVAATTAAVAATTATVKKIFSDKSTPANDSTVAVPEPASSSTVSPSEVVQPKKFVYFVDCTWPPSEGIFIVIASTSEECACLIKTNVDQPYHQNVDEQVGKAKYLELKDVSLKSKIFDL